MQIGTNAASLRVALIATSIGIPFSIVLGGLYELYISLGKQSYAHLRTPFAEKFLGIVGLIASIALMTAVGALIWYLLPAAVWCFGVAAFVGLCLFVFFYAALAVWWFEPGGPGRREHESNAA